MKSWRSLPAAWPCANLRSPGDCRCRCWWGSAASIVSQLHAVQQGHSQQQPAALLAVTPGAAGAGGHSARGAGRRQPLHAAGRAGGRQVSGRACGTVLARHTVLCASGRAGGCEVRESMVAPGAESGTWPSTALSLQVADSVQFDHATCQHGSSASPHAGRWCAWWPGAALAAACCCTVAWATWSRRAGACCPRTSRAAARPWRRCEAAGKCSCLAAVSVYCVSLFPRCWLLRACSATSVVSHSSRHQRCTLSSSQPLQGRPQEVYGAFAAFRQRRCRPLPPGDKQGKGQGSGSADAAAVGALAVQATAGPGDGSSSTGSASAVAAAAATRASSRGSSSSQLELMNRQAALADRLVYLGELLHILRPVVYALSLRR